MKITMLIGKLSGGGAERVTCNLANFLADKGHEVEILTLSEDTPVEPLRGVKHIPLLKNAQRGNVLKNSWRRISGLRRYMKTQAVDAYIVMLPLTTILMLLFSRLTKAAIIAAERVDPASYRGLNKWLLQHLARRADCWVFQTEQVKQWYEPWLKGTPGVVIPNAINPAFIRPDYTGPRENTIAAAGRLTYQKNFALLIRSFAAVAEEFPDYSLTIYGKGPELENLRQTAREAGVEDRVIFAGHVDNMPEKLEKAAAFVLSSDFEGMPNVLMEAMALGLPCVATDCGGGGAAFLIENGVNGLLVPVRDEQAVAKAIRQILSDPAAAKTMGENARQLRSRLAPQEIYGRWEKQLQEAAAKKTQA